MKILYVKGIYNKMFFKLLDTKNPEIVSSTDSSLYNYVLYCGHNLVHTNKTSSYWYLEEDTVKCVSGNGQSFLSSTMCVEILGYTPENRTSTYSKNTELPYINGCSTKQLIPPVRPGDPTFQLLYMPPHTTEQQHHIHATVRIVYVYKGFGHSIIGSSYKNEKIELTSGKILLLNEMVSHHFETEDSDLIVLPLHIFSSVSSEEFNHPMFNGTHKI